MYIIIIGGGRVGYYLARALMAEGHEVLIVETRPLSRNKHWRVRKVVREAALPGGSS